METSTAPADSTVDEDGHSLPVRFLLLLRSSFLVFIAFIGVLLFLTGSVLSEGVVAGMLGITGVSAILYAAIGFAFLRAIGYR